MNNKTLIGVDLGGTNVRSGLVSGQEIIKTDSDRIQSKSDEDIVIEQVINSISRVMSPEVEAIGIGVPGILDTKTGIVYDVQNIPSWKAVPLKSILEQRFHVPVLMNNDANCFAAGEWHYGKGKGKNNLTGLILGTGVAAGLLCDGKLYEGRNCGAGEFGMIPYLDHNYEFYCSGNFFSHFHQISGEELSKRAASGDPSALQIFQEYGKHLSWLIKTILYSVDPEMIVLGGSVSKAFPFFQSTLWAQLQDFPYQPVIKNIGIANSEIDNIAILGAAALYFNQKE
ncbi:ROK family protein [Pedobacter sp. PLR]|uniref:ROK family protein n=1 Tax=Pedobacter sp. PLR TaxID=2994465 RepID=UPI0022458131|nr:ROK family protein [Pedobacter sp. PLR]MCX2450017.1 ROK family protein [Pedobacter sp. PLR]